mmetsp:Transcript_27556/g.31731  ORF Transcript_27556/g.31731 Transcript_27556/m.31731 type:complete len:204 (-) Transcript_27556:163-774(-)
MSAINITNIVVNNNPANFEDSFSFDITFECLTPLTQDIEFKLIYIGSAENEDFDQILDNVFIGPLTYGTMKLTFETDGPNPSKIPSSDLLGITAILITGSYLEREFFRVGYYVNNTYIDPALVENPPNTPDLSKVQRSILADKPRVSRFAIEWIEGVQGQLESSVSEGRAEDNIFASAAINEYSNPQDIRRDLGTHIREMNKR